MTPFYALEKNNLNACMVKKTTVERSDRTFPNTIAEVQTLVTNSKQLKNLQSTYLYNSFVLSVYRYI